MKHIENLCKQASKDLDLDEELVTRVYKLYWFTIKETLKEKANISIPSLGKFYLKNVSKNK